jgi:hypothetical protein
MEAMTLVFSLESQVTKLNSSAHSPKNMISSIIIKCYFMCKRLNFYEKKKKLCPWVLDSSPSLTIFNPYMIHIIISMKWNKNYLLKITFLCMPELGFDLCLSDSLLLS